MFTTLYRFGITIVFTALVLTTTGCSIFISTSKVARIHIRRPGNKPIEYTLKYKDPHENNLDVHLDKKYSLRFDFKWLLYKKNNSIETHVETGADITESQLTPWILINYRF